MILIKIEQVDRLGHIYLANTYIHPLGNEETIDLMTKELKSLRNLIVVGDLNAHNKKWSQAKPNSLGSLIPEFANEFKLTILNKKANRLI